MFSEELYELDRNTVQCMIDEMQDTIDAQNDKLEKQEVEMAHMQKQLSLWIRNVIDMMRKEKLSEDEITGRLVMQYQLTEKQAKEYMEAVE